MSYGKLVTKDTGLYADTVEWCPLESYQDILACGTYQLIENDAKHQHSGRRIGGLKFYRITESGLDLQEIYETQTDAGILDMKWYPTTMSDRGILGAVTSESKLKICSFLFKEGIQALEETIVSIGSDKICLSLDWSAASSEPKCIVSDSHGQLTLLQCPEASWGPILQWTGHDYEAWVCAFNKWIPHIIYSGGDDCRLKGWDTRSDCAQPIFSSKKHEMGVSSIQYNPVYEHIMATGSYDEKIHVWDTRNMNSPLCSSKPGGGVWRIKWNPHTGDYILTASMYDGFHILCYDGSRIDLLVSFKEDFELAYGADWCRKPKAETQNNTSLVATCSFYDHILHFWQVNY